MTVTDNRKPIVDIDMWDSMADFPLVSSAGVELCGSDDASRPDLYLGYLNATYRYCAIANGFQAICPNHLVNVTRSSLKFSHFQGYRGNCLGSTNNTMDIAGLTGDVLNGKTIKIVGGTGIGQERIISDVADPVIFERGIATTASNVLITDALKKWKVNQWIGYQVRLVQNTGVTQVRKILYNDVNTLYFYDANYQQLEVWNNNPFCAIAPYAAPVAGVTGTATHFIIEKSTITVDSNRTVNPDASSSFVIQGGGFFNLGGLATTPFSNFSYYDIISDTYTYKTPPLSVLTAALGTDYALEKLRDYKNISGNRYAYNISVGSFSGKTITISTLGWTNNQWKNYNVKVVSGTGIGQERRIIANTATRVVVDRNFDVNLDNTSKFDISADIETIFMVGNTFSAMMKYCYDRDMRSVSNKFDFGTARNGAIAYGGQEAYGITSITYLATGITSLTAIPVAKGTLYSVGDVLTIDAKGGKCIVETISAGGLVETVALVNAGTAGYTIGTKSTTGGTGTLCTVDVASVGKVGKVVTASNVNLAIGDAFVISGSSVAGYNGASSVLCIDTLTSFDILCPSASANYAPTLSQSATVLVDSTKNRIPKEHIGKLVATHIAGYNGAVLWRKITDNTATSLTFATITTAPVNGLGRYFIADVKPFGKAKQFLIASQSEDGFATSGSTATLVDTTKSWIPNCRVGYKFRIISGAGIELNEIAITSNTKTTLNFATQTVAIDSTTEYEIMDTYGTATAGSTTVLTDSTKNRAVNQFTGMRVRFTSGTGQNVEQIIITNTATTLTYALGTAPDTTTTYAILDSNSSTATGRGVATKLVWDYVNNNGKFMYCFRGGNTNIIDRYNISTEKFDIVYFNGYGQSELFTTGTQYAFDGKSRIYINPNGTQRVLYYDIILNKIYPFTYFPETQGTAIIGNRMEVVQETNGLKYLYMNRQSTVNFYRVLLPTY